MAGLSINGKLVENPTDYKIVADLIMEIRPDVSLGDNLTKDVIGILDINGNKRLDIDDVFGWNKDPSRLEADIIRFKSVACILGKYAINQRFHCDTKGLSRIVEVNDDESLVVETRKIHKQDPEAKIVVLLSADWCKPCGPYQPFFDQIVSENSDPHIHFVHAYSKNAKGMDFSVFGSLGLGDKIGFPAVVLYDPEKCKTISRVTHLYDPLADLGLVKRTPEEEINYLKQCLKNIPDIYFFEVIDRLLELGVDVKETLMPFLTGEYDWKLIVSGVLARLEQRFPNEIYQLRSKLLDGPNCIYGIQELSKLDSAASPAIPRIKTLINSDQPSMRAEAVLFLDKFATPKILDILRQKIIFEDDSNAFSSLIRIFCESRKDRKAYDYFYRRIGDLNPNIALSAADAVITLRPEVKENIYRALLNHSNTKIQAIAIGRLGYDKKNGGKFIPIVTRLLKSADAEVRAEAVNFIADNLGSRAFANIIALIAIETNPKTFERALYEAIKIVEQVRNTESNSDQTSRTAKLSTKLQVELQTTVLKRIEDPDPEIRKGVIQFMRDNMDATSAKDFILKRLRVEDNPDVLEQVINAAGALKIKEALPILDTLKDKEGVGIVAIMAIEDMSETEEIEDKGGTEETGEKEDTEETGETEETEELFFK